MTKRIASKPQRTDTPKSFRFSDHELAILEQASKKAGSVKKAIMLGLEGYVAGTALNRATALKYIEENLK